MAMALGMVVWLGSPSVASADAARPTDLSSTVDAVTRADGGGAPEVQVRIIGGDAFLEIRATPGHRVVIEGYDREQYRRIDADGSVWENRRAAATYLNRDRAGATPLPGDVSSTAEPDWQRIGTGGSTTFHDHRVHWMGTTDPPVDADGVVQRWTVPIMVDDQAVTITGTLRRLDAPNPLPWIGALALSAVALWFAPAPVRRLALVAVAMIAVVVAVGAHTLNPPGAVGLPSGVIVSAGGLVAALAALRWGRPVTTMAAVAALGAWAGLRWQVWFRAVVPTELPAWSDRLGTALVAGVVLAVAIDATMRPTPITAAAAIGAPPPPDASPADGSSPPTPDPHPQGG